MTDGYEAYDRIGHDSDQSVVATHKLASEAAVLLSSPPQASGEAQGAAQETPEAMDEANIERSDEGRPDFPFSSLEIRGIADAIGHSGFNDANRAVVDAINRLNIRGRSSDETEADLRHLATEINRYLPPRSALRMFSGGTGGGWSMNRFHDQTTRDGAVLRRSLGDINVVPGQQIRLREPRND